MKKVLSFVLTLAMIVSVFAGFSVVNVSAHQNYTMETITFDETTPVSDSNPTGYKYGTGNINRTEGFKSIEQYFDGGKITAFHNNKYYFNDVAEAPDNRYGKSLLIREYWETGASTQYVQTSLDPTPLLCGTVNVTASLYTKKNENDRYIQRAVYLRSQNDNGGYTNKAAVLFAHDKSRTISAFGTATGKNYKTDVWYDIDLTYNMDNGQYHLVIFEDGVEYINVTGTDAGEKIPNVNTMILYHSTTNANCNDMWIYWDNLSIKSANKFVIAEDNSSKEIFDYTEFPGGNPANQPASTRGSWSYGYNNASKKSIADSYNDSERGEVLKWFGPVWDEETAFDDAATDKNLKHYYNYPRMIYNIADKHFTNDLVQISMKLKTNQDGELAALYLNNQGSAPYSPLMLYSNTFKICNKETKVAYERDVWYDVNIIIDTATGYFNGSIIHPTDEEKNVNASGYNSTMKCDVTSVMFRMDRLSKAATMANECAVYIDDLYIGAPYDSELPKVALTSVAATATAEEAATQTLYLPYAKSYAGHDFKATLTIEGSAPTVTVGDAAIDVSALTPGSYPLNVVMMTGETPEVNVTLNGEAVAAEFASIPTAITLTAPAGEGNTASVTDVSYDIINKFEIKGDSIIEGFKIDDVVVIEFTNPLADSVVAENFVTYKPTGTLSDAVKVEDAVVTIAKDKKSVTLSFDKDKSTHYHIAFEVTDLFGATLSDFVEVNTEKPTVVTDAVKFYDADGNAVTTLPSRGDVYAKVNAYSGDGKTYDANMWIALYDEAGKLKSVKFAPVEITPEEQELSSDIYVPGDGKAYFVKAGIVLPNLKPVAFGTIHTQVIIIRLDDLKVGTMDAYSALTDWAAENEVALSIGMVCNSIDEDNGAYIQTVKDMVNTGFVEIWCHGYDHTYHEGTGVTAEFTRQTAEYQAEVLRRCYDAVYEKTDGVVKLSCLGTPSGGMDENTFAALEMVPEFKANFGSTSVPYDGNGFANLTNSLWMEPSTGKLQTLDTLKGYYDSRTVGKEYMIFGCHAGYFSDEDMDTLKAFVEYLKTKDLVFMTPSQYADFIY